MGPSILLWFWLLVPSPKRKREIFYYLIAVAVIMYFTLILPSGVLGAYNDEYQLQQASGQANATEIVNRTECAINRYSGKYCYRRASEKTEAKAMLIMVIFLGGIGAVIALTISICLCMSSADYYPSSLRAHGFVLGRPEPFRHESYLKPEHRAEGTHYYLVPVTDVFEGNRVVSKEVHV